MEYQFNHHYKTIQNMKKENNSPTLLKVIKTLFKPKKTTQKNGRPKRDPRWMYRND